MADLETLGTLLTTNNREEYLEALSTATDTPREELEPNAAPLTLGALQALAAEQLGVSREDLSANTVDVPDADDLPAEAHDLAGEIVANSAEYSDTDAVLADYPTLPSLQLKRERLTAGGALPGATRARANVGDGPDEDVSTGVFE